jgi:hypothetical protein
MQLEAVSDYFLDRELDEVQCAMLHRLGFASPGSLGDDFLNWVQFRVGEGTEPFSVSRFLVACLKNVYRVRIHEVEFEWIASDELFDLNGTIERPWFK